jgi:SpoIID/LytB domain protein
VNQKFQTLMQIKQTMTRKGSQTSFFFLFSFSCITGWGFAASSMAKEQAKELEIQIGIVQRFGQSSTDQLTLTSTDKDSLVLTLPNNKGQTKTIESNKIELEVVKQSLKKPRLEERLVLSDHSTFETAEDTANQWKAKGIKVEITQPDRWQVWAKRDVYSTPLLRRWLWQSLQSQGYTQAYLETALVAEKPQVAIKVNGERYLENQFEIVSGKNPIQVKEAKNPTRLYGGSLKIQPNAYGSFTLVNQVPLEVYLRGVVPHEIGPEAPENATRAQTIIARTYALRNLRRFAADNYQLCASVHCQVYYGLTGATNRADRAIADTKGLVLTYQNELVDALYSSTTGGVTATFGDVWNGEERPYLKAIIDSPNQVWDLSKNSLSDEETFRDFINLKNGFNETGRKVFRWNRESTVEELNKDLKKYLERRRHPLANFQTIQSIQVTKRAPSGRILTLQVQTDRGLIELYKNDARSAFGPPLSTLFYVEPVYDEKEQLKKVAFIGGGFGHGVGLSQFGSYNLANLGWSYEKILSFYYPGTKLQSLNDSIIFWQESNKTK